MVTSVNVRFAQENLAATYDELWPLFERHKAEVAPFPDWTLNPNKKRYLEVELAGCLRLYTVRQLEQLIGYVVFIVGAHPHYIDQTVATADILYVVPEHRNGRIGKILCEYAREALVSEGFIDAIVHRTKVLKKLYIGRLYKSLGMVPLDESWVERLPRTRTPHD